MSATTQAGRLWQFKALDTWFFRESRPFDSIGGAQLASHFPPPARTLAGAVRTAIGEAQGVNWPAFNSNDATYAALRAQIGNAESYGQLQMHGPFLLHGGERLFPAPLMLLEKDGVFVRLAPGVDLMESDLGPVCLPQLQQPLPGAKALENVWLTRAGLETVLAGGVPVAADVRRAKDLFGAEERLGIGRDNARRANVEGLLYQTRHVRPRNDVTLGVQVAGIDAAYHPRRGAIRLGGEGRFASFTVSESLPAALNVPPSSRSGVLLTLLTPADFGGDWKPTGFKDEERSGVVNGIELTIAAAVLGKAGREGGWDLAGRKPRALRSLVPAGSCYFCRVEGDAQQAAAQLQHQKIGLETELGRGEIAVGYWDGL